MAKYITLERLFIVVALIVFILMWHNCGRHTETIIKTIPEYVRTTDTIVFNHIKEKKIYLQGKTVYVDSLRYINYHKSDTIKKDSMYVDAITAREYDTIMEDNDRIKLELHSKVFGRLASSSIKYTIKEIKVEPIVQRPKLSLLLGAGLRTDNKVFLSTGLQIRNGFAIQGTIDNKAAYSVELSKAFTILK